MATQTISENHSLSQFKDYVTVRERLVLCGLNHNPKNIPMSKYRSRKDDQKAFRRYLQNQTPPLIYAGV